MKDDILKLTGRIARNRRIKANLTMKKAGELFGCSESAISRIENGEIDNLCYYLFALWGFSWVGFYEMERMEEQWQKENMELTK